MRAKKIIISLAGLLFVGVFCLNSGAFGSVPSGEVFFFSEKGAEQARLPSEVVFIDPSVQDSATIVAQLPEKALVVQLSPGTGAVAQISAHLEKKRYLSAIRVISHGNAGYFVLNGKRIDRDFLRDHGDRISTWGRALAENGDFLLYACNLASTDEGKAFVEHLADLTGADVAASTDVTGELPTTDHRSLTTSSDWDLEYNTGAIDSIALCVDQYNATLGTTNVNSRETLNAGIAAFNMEIDTTLNFTDHFSVNGAITDIIATSGTLTIDMHGKTITLDNSSDTVFINATGNGATITFSASGRITHRDGTGGGNAINITGASTLNVNGVNDTLTLAGDDAGIFIADAATLTVTGKLNLTGDTVVLGNDAQASGTIIYGGDADQSIDTGLTYYNFMISGSSSPAALGADLDVNGNVTISNFNTFNSGGYNINVAGNWKNDGTFTPGTGTVIFDGTSGTQTIGRFGEELKDQTFYNVTCPFGKPE